MMGVNIALREVKVQVRGGHDIDEYHENDTPFGLGALH